MRPQSGEVCLRHANVQLSVAIPCKESIVAAVASRCRLWLHTTFLTCPLSCQATAQHTQQRKQTHKVLVITVDASAAADPCPFSN